MSSERGRPDVENIGPPSYSDTDEESEDVGVILETICIEQSELTATIKCLEDARPAGCASEWCRVLSAPRGLQVPDGRGETDRERHPARNTLRRRARTTFAAEALEPLEAVVLDIRTTRSTTLGVPASMASKFNTRPGAASNSVPEIERIASARGFDIEVERDLLMADLDADPSAPMTPDQKERFRRIGEADVGRNATDPLLQALGEALQRAGLSAFNPDITIRNDGPTTLTVAHRGLVIFTLDRAALLARAEQIAITRHIRPH
jgi:hypothetical protein